MAGQISLKALVYAITGAVSAAQAEVERAQLLNLGRYFDDKRRPMMMKMRLPTLAAPRQPSSADQDPPAAGAEGQLIGVPLLTLVPQSQLRIKEVEFRFEVDLGDVSDKVEDPQPAVVDDMTGSYRVLTVDHGTRLLGRRRPAKVVVKVEAAEPIEGVARLVNELNKYIGVPLPEEPAPTSSTDAASGS